MTMGERMLLAVFMTTALLWFAVPAEAQQNTDHYQRGVEAYEQGEYELAANIWLIEAYEGSADAQFNLGVMFIEGKGVEQDRDEAVFWFTKAARLGHPDAQYNLGHLLLEQAGKDGNADEALEWWRLSAESGYAAAQFNYGRALYYGIGGDADIAESKVWLSRAADQGQPSAIRFMEKHGDIFVAMGEQQITDSTAREVANDVSKTGSEITATEPVDSDRAASVSDSDRTEDSDGDAIVAGDASASSLTGGDEALVEYAILRDDPILAHTRFNARAPVVELVPAKTLLRIRELREDWVRVEIPGGFPAWIRDSAASVKGDIATTLASAQLFADPTDQSDNNTMGSVDSGSQLLILQRQGSWIRVQLPEFVTAWIEYGKTAAVKKDPDALGTLWQAQSISMRIQRMADHEALSKPVPEAVSVNDVSTSETSGSSKSTATTAGSESEASFFPSETDNPPGTSVSSGDDSDSTDSDSIDDWTVEQLVEQRQLSDDVGQISEDSLQAELETVDIFKVVRPDSRLFSSPASQSRQLFRISTGTLVDIVTTQGEWARVSVPGGLPVWIQAIDADPAEGIIAVTGSRVKVRAQPSVQSTVPVLGLVGTGMRLQLLEKREDWYRVLAPEWITAWIPQENIEPLDGSASEQQNAWTQQRDSLIARYTQSSTKTVQSSSKPQSTAQADGSGESPEQKIVTRTANQPKSPISTEPPLSHSTAQTFPANDNDWIFTQPDGRYTLQLFSVQSRQDALNLYASLRQPARLFSTVIRGDRWYFVLLGEFASSADAQRVRQTLPKWARNASVRTFSRLKNKRCAKLGTLAEFEARGLEKHCN
ncbi:MAG: SPOR domain-containing protein [Pseudomonadota bacterium]